MNKSTNNLFESVTLEERQQRLKDPNRYVDSVVRHLEMAGKTNKGVYFLTEEDEKTIKGLLVHLVECATKDQTIKEHWEIVYPVFLATILSYIKKK